MAFTLRGELSRAAKDRGSKCGDTCSHPHERERERERNPKTGGHMLLLIPGRFRAQHSHALCDVGSDLVTFDFLCARHGIDTLRA